MTLSQGRWSFSVILNPTVSKISCFCWAGCFSLCTLCSLVRTAWHNRPSIPDNKTHQPYMGLFGALTQQALRSTVCVQIVFVLTVHSCSKEALISRSQAGEGILLKDADLGIEPNAFSAGSRPPQPLSCSDTVFLCVCCGFLPGWFTCKSAWTTVCPSSPVTCTSPLQSV